MLESNSLDQGLKERKGEKVGKSNSKSMLMESFKLENKKVEK